MLGYVKCDEGELLVKHQKLYHAAYCGLCHSIRKNGAACILPFFSYDFVFLALVRLLVTAENIELERDFCLFHPFRKKKQRVKDNKALSYSSFAALVLCTEKMRDDGMDPDTGTFKKLLCRLFLPGLDRACIRLEKREKSYQGLSSLVRKILAEGREWEKQGASLDQMCQNFASCLSIVFSFGTEGVSHRLLSGIGEFLGRYLYLLDALDDLEKDREKGSFNPLLASASLPEREEWVRLDMVASFYLQEIEKILDLAEGSAHLLAICKNIVCRGLPGQMKKIIESKIGVKK